MSLEERRRPRLAVLIDAENIGASRAGALFEAVAKRGTATARRVYGDWTRTDMTRWRDALHEHAIIPVQQFRLSKGKNCIDCALIVDAMDLLHSRQFDGFCIVSSDADFTRLACRIRESGLLVFGFGEATAPKTFRKSCDEFIILGSTNPAPAAPAAAKVPKPSPNGDAPPKPNAAQRAMLEAAHRASAGEDGWAPLTTLGGQIRKLSPSFKPSDLGCGKLSRLVETIGLFEVDQVPSPKNPATPVWRVKWREENGPESASGPETAPDPFSSSESPPD